MGYQGIMGYGVDFPLSRLGKAIILWVIRVYGLPEVWVKRVSTVSCALSLRTPTYGLRETTFDAASDLTMHLRTPALDRRARCA